MNSVHCTSLEARVGTAAFTPHTKLRQKHSISHSFSTRPPVVQLWRSSVMNFTCPAPEVEAGLIVWSPQFMSHCGCQSHVSATRHECNTAIYSNGSSNVNYVRPPTTPPPHIPASFCCSVGFGVNPVSAFVTICI